MQHTAIIGSDRLPCKSEAITRRGRPEVLQVVENELRAPSAKVRNGVLAVPVCGPDVRVRHGRTPISPRAPFVPGDAIVGVVDAIGQGVTRAAARPWHQRWRAGRGSHASWTPELARAGVQRLEPVLYHQRRSRHERAC